LVEGSVEVGLSLKDGDRLEFGKGRHLKVFHTPGHSRGSIALFFDKDGVLFSGDAIPVPRSVPIYEDITSSIRSIRKLMAIDGIEFLLASWEEPHHGPGVYDIMKDGLSYLQEIQNLVLEEHARLPRPELPELGSRVLRRLGLPETALMPMVMKSFEAHLRLSEYQDLSRI
jgi:glyoxylase-like metal-dependent hydrolase (beta-lactamase superfamily II)